MLVCDKVKYRNREEAPNHFYSKSTLLCESFPRSSFSLQLIKVEVGDSFKIGKKYLALPQSGLRSTAQAAPSALQECGSGVHGRGIQSWHHWWAAGRGKAGKWHTPGGGSAPSLHQTTQHLQVQLRPLFPTSGWPFLLCLLCLEHPSHSTPPGHTSQRGLCALPSYV